jgi:XTP/dITP diphosphohydrolase
MSSLLIATNNNGKVRELEKILADPQVTLLTPKDIGLVLDVEETGATYADNAILKARAFAQASGLISVADDSGLEVDALDGRPGVYSARYAGEGATDADRRAKMLRELHAVAAPRLARFRCVIAVARTPDDIQVFEGVCEGEIIFEERGSNGFGYDPIFFMPEHGRTMAELPSELKNQVSHRARATLKAKPYLLALTTASRDRR